MWLLGLFEPDGVIQYTSQATRRIGDRPYEIEALRQIEIEHGRIRLETTLIAKLKSNDICTEPESQMLSRGTAAPLKFGESDGYQLELRRRVDAYFKTTGKSPRDCARMYLKTATILSWFVGSYVALVFFAATWWQAVPLAISLGLAMAGIGFSIQHDGGHQAYSNRSWVNTG